MSVRHPRVIEWEQRLKGVFDRIDATLEATYADRFQLHPARPEHGATENPADGGLFDLGAAFSAGYGSQHGRGYTVQIRLATLQRIPPELVEAVEDEVLRRLAEELPQAFPGRDLRVTRDGTVYKIVGDSRL